MIEKLYSGERMLNGPARVMVRTPSRCYALPLHLELWSHSPTGFEWGYGGSGPAQLALAIMFDATGDKRLALGTYQWFKWAIVSQWPRDRWELTTAEILAWLERFETEERAKAYYASHGEPEPDEDEDEEDTPLVERACRICGCTEEDCRQCIEATGSPCSWDEDDPEVCSRCAAERDRALAIEMEGGAD